MSVLIRENGLVIREMAGGSEDLHLLLRWMTDPETMRFWDGMTVRHTYETVAERFRKHLDEGVSQCIVEYEGKPIGYCQYYLTDAQEYEIPAEQYLRFAGEGERVYGIDIFLGEASCRDKGIGTRCMRLLARLLFERFHADLLLIDPKVCNARAIRCYHKSGFEDYLVAPKREEQDGVLYDSLIMGMRREALERKAT